MNDFTSGSSAATWLVWGLWGLAWGAVNAWLVAAPVRRLARAAIGPDQAGTLQQQVLVRYLLRMGLSFVSLLVVFLVTGRVAAILATLVGIILAGDVPLFFLMRTRRERA